METTNKTSILRKVLLNFEEYFAAIILFIMTMIVFINVLSRYFFKFDIAYTYEIVTILFVWISLIGTAVGFKKNSHIGFDLILKSLTPNSRKVLELIIIALVIVLSFFWFTNGIEMMKTQMKYNQTTSTIGIPTYLVYGSVFPISSVLIVVNLIRYKIGGERKS